MSESDTSVSGLKIDNLKDGERYFMVTKRADLTSPTLTQKNSNCLNFKLYIKTRLTVYCGTFYRKTKVSDDQILSLEDFNDDFQVPFLVMIKRPGCLFSFDIGPDGVNLTETEKEKFYFRIEEKLLSELINKSSKCDSLPMVTYNFFESRENLNKKLVKDLI